MSAKGVTPSPYLQPNALDQALEGESTSERSAVELARTIIGETLFTARKDCTPDLCAAKAIELLYRETELSDENRTHLRASLADYCYQARFHTGRFRHAVSERMFSEIAGGVAREITVRIFEEQGSYCFLSGTMITLADGSEKPIEWLKTGDRVLSCDPETKLYRTGTVHGTERKEASFHYRVNDMMLALTGSTAHLRAKRK